MSAREKPIPTFEDLARLPDDDIDVAIGSGLVARDVYPDLDVGAVVAELGALGEPLAARARELASASAVEQCAAVSELFLELGFQGNVEQYDDEKNSLLPDVLARKKGIPISLALVWCSIARHARISARGVGFPGHYLVRVDGPQGPPKAARPAGGTWRDESFVVLDPFGACRNVDETIATAILQRAQGKNAKLHPAHFAPSSNRDTLVRMLANLEGLWTKDAPAKAFVACNRILTLLRGGGQASVSPIEPRFLRNRAMLARRIGDKEVAIADLERLLELQPDSLEAPFYRAELAKLTGRARKKTTLH